MKLGQMVYAVRDARTLKRSLAGLAFLTLTTTTVAFVVGIIMAAIIRGWTFKLIQVILRRP